MKTLLTPGILLLAVAVLLHTGLLAPSPAFLNSALYGIGIAGLMLAWRFHSSRIFSSLVALLLAQRALSYFAGNSAASGPGTAAIAAVGILLPLNFVAISLQKEKGFIFSSLAPGALALFVESVIVAVACRPMATVAGHAGAHRAALGPAGLSFPTQWAFAAAAVILLIRYFLFRKPVESGLLWALAASFLALHFGGMGKLSTAYFATAAFVLAGAIVETSYLLAYHDELTALPSRRAFHEALLRLESPYSIAMVDIDHFKRCNDAYGHDTGDQVLRMVASRLARVSGGGEAFRCGGEEFAILFPGKTTADVIDHLEKLRSDIEASTLRLRGPDRRQEPRGPDRRIARGRSQQGRAIRQLSRTPATNTLSVTASMGVATSGPAYASAKDVIKAADEALYRAKDGGRNRIESGPAPRKLRAKSAGIA